LVAAFPGRDFIERSSAQINAAIPGAGAFDCAADERNIKKDVECIGPPQKDCI
jgi:hypothetical protein